MTAEEIGAEEWALHSLRNIVPFGFLGQYVVLFSRGKDCARTNTCEIRVTLILTQVLH